MPTSSDELTQPTRRILHADDNPYTLSVAEVALTNAGYTVDTVASIADAKAYMTNKRAPDLVILDLHFGDGSGFELAQLFYEQEVPIVFLAPITDEEDVLRALTEFSADYISKPFSPGELVARINRTFYLLEKNNAANAPE